ncbi:vWA domain-containing protein [Chthonobacter rhizosphaerae]|uniref:vWA domain-containing protein n=1 Tax=Chthonobacter rhizosphaerae TaxID=2735553 RepID=UPI0015EE8D85|nr:VWA domain-containing protein [Chthonobacter rhizosphaerae]
MTAPALEDPADIGPAARRRLSGFVRTLRDNGFAIGLAETRDGLAVLAAAPFGRPATVKPALKALFCGRRSDFDRFDDLFDAYWQGRGVKASVAVSGTSPKASQRTLRTLQQGTGSGGEPGPAIDVDRRPDAPDGDASPEGRREGATRHESLARTDFRKIADPDELALAHALAERLARRMRARLTRRDKASARGGGLDLRGTIRRSLSTGGTPLRLVRRKPRHKPLRLVLLVDASGSMSLYTGVFLRFVHGVLDQFREAEAFLFHTRLVHVSDALREKDAARALDRLGLMAEGVGGGTRIGDSLATFNRWHAARVIHSRTCVMILSDGYDTGEPEPLGAEMAALGRRCRRIVWLNPMIGWAGYEPVARGMAAALPHVDLFAPAHTLDSLAALEPYLARI